MAKDKKYAEEIDDEDDVDIDDFEEFPIETLESKSGNNTARRRIEELKEELYLLKQINDNYLEWD